jgi:hypothetical protein
MKHDKQTAWIVFGGHLFFEATLILTGWLLIYCYHNGII